MRNDIENCCLFCKGFHRNPLRNAGELCSPCIRQQMHGGAKLHLHRWNRRFHHMKYNVVGMLSSQETTDFSSETEGFCEIQESYALHELVGGYTTDDIISDCFSHSLRTLLLRFCLKTLIYCEASK